MTNLIGQEIKRGDATFRICAVQHNGQGWRFLCARQDGTFISLGIEDLHLIDVACTLESAI